ncbi:hypothetical protein TNCV_3311231 [Trichonephila clavipes]|nr:hypothetical protein TNCV_3311231 [Trichonephila clavipes]
MTTRGRRLPTLCNRSQDEDVETWMAYDGKDCAFQMLNDDEIVISVQEESDSDDKKTDEDEDNYNNKNSKGPSYADTFYALETGMNNNQSSVLLNYYCSVESEAWQRKNEGIQWYSEK